MRRREFKQGKPYIVEEYGSYEELIDTINKRPIIWSNREPAKVEVDNNKNPWSGERTYEDAICHLRNGCEDSYGKLKNTLSFKTRTIKKPAGVQNDIVGFAPNVPNTIMNLPNSMLNTKLIPKKSKVIDVIIDIVVSCGVCIDDFCEYAKKVLRKIVELEESGYRIRITVAGSFTEENSSSQGHVVKVVIKNENQPLNMKRVSYPIAGKGMFRRIFFSWYETLPKQEKLDGYGTGAYLWKNQDAVKKIDSILIGENKNSIIIRYKDDLNKKFGRLK